MGPNKILTGHWHCWGRFSKNPQRWTAYLPFTDFYIAFFLILPFCWEDWKVQSEQRDSHFQGSSTWMLLSAIQVYSGQWAMLSDASRQLRYSQFPTDGHQFWESRLGVRVWTRFASSANPSQDQLKLLETLNISVAVLIPSTTDLGILLTSQGQSKN